MSFFGCARSFLQYTGSFSFGAQALKCAGSVVVMPMLSCPVAYGTLVPVPRIKPTTPALGDRFLTTEPPRKFPKLKKIFFTTGLCWLSILNIAVCTCQFQTPKLSLSLTLLPLVIINSFSKSASVSVL